MKQAKKPLLLTASALCVLLVAGCSSGQPAATAENEMKTACLDGVMYYLFKESRGYAGWGYMAPKYKPDGTLALCN